MRIVFLFALLIFTACQRKGLDVYTDLIDKEGRASHFTRTPDPFYCDNYCLHRIVATWHLSTCDWGKKPLCLKMVVRYGDGSEKELEFPIKKRISYQTYDLFGEELQDKEGIKTYRVEVASADETLHTFEHQIWQERIRIQREQSPI